MGREIGRMRLALCVCLLLLAAVWAMPLVEDSNRLDTRPELLDEAMATGPDDSPDWTLGKGEAPSGVKKMPGGWTMHVFSQEQQGRLGVNMYGEPREFKGDIGASADADSDSSVWLKTRTKMPATMMSRMKNSMNKPQARTAS